MTSAQLDLFDVSTSSVGVSVVDAEDKLPKIAREIYNLVGLDGLVRIVNRWAGVHMDFPAHARNLDTSVVVQQLADEIGQADARKVAIYFMGTRLQVPMCAAALREVRDAKIRAELDANMPAHEIARRHKMTERSVWRIGKRV